MVASAPMSWKILNSTVQFTAGFFNLRRDECELPDGRVMPRYYVMEFLDWVNVIAVSPEGQMIMVQQYRHAAAETFLELPGGSTDPGETPAAAAARELKEETGFVAEQWIDCGFHFPNPALQNNRMHTFLALGCTRVAKPQLDPFEDLITVIVPATEVYEQWAGGKMKHSLIVASLALGQRYLRERKIIP